ncbi:hypothetical protein NPIL_213621 [Nephila pilipes]|uniref:Uncharacterized protein n=1 Tax=Nephila pilipes TaxID=299642 RepID=A0A8X6T5G7_NEPPI|nr:hypothetical protein NPIL_213621 [Nephila pilipes]
MCPQGNLSSFKKIHTAQINKTQRSPKSKFIREKVHQRKFTRAPPQHTKRSSNLRGRPGSNGKDRSKRGGRPENKQEPQGTRLPRESFKRRRRREPLLGGSRGRERRSSGRPSTVSKTHRQEQLSLPILSQSRARELTILLVLIGKAFFPLFPTRR